jgi:hypothetical protein
MRRFFCRWVMPFNYVLWILYFVLAVLSHLHWGFFWAAMAVGGTSVGTLSLFLRLRQEEPHPVRRWCKPCRKS